MAFSSTLDFPYSSAVAVATVVPNIFDVAIAGRPFMLDRTVDGSMWNHQSIQYLTKFLTSPVFGSPTTAAEVGETSLNPDINWRRSAGAWHHGAGQPHYDLRESDRARFNASKGIDCWTVGKLALLPDTASKRATTNTNLQLVTAGTRLYLADGSALKYTTDLVTWTDAGVTTAVASIASDGHTTWVAVPGGVYTMTTSDSAVGGTAYNALVPDLLGYCKGRLMAAVGNVLYNITSGTTPAALFTHDNTNWRWVGFASGDTCIYAAGYSGDYSAVYRIPVKADGSALDAPVQAGELPKGETALTITSYLGLVFVGTTVGLRLATQGSSGELSMGSALPVGPVRCASGDGRFVWFGWENYDTTTTGLGRADVTAINVDAPAYATDLQAATQGEISSVVTFAGKRVFAVSGVGIYQETAALVASGTLDGGLITFDLPDPKVAQAITVLHSTPLVGSFGVTLAVDEGPMVLLGTHTSASADTPFTCSSAKGAVFEVRLTLSRDTTDTTAGPTVSRHTVMAIPAALSGEQIMVPLVIAAEVQPAVGSAVMRDPGDDLAFLTNLRKTKQQFVYQEAATNYRCTMADWQFFPKQLTPTRQAFEGTFIAQLLHQDQGD